MADPGGRALILINGRVHRLRRFATAKPPNDRKMSSRRVGGRLTGSAMSRGRAPSEKRLPRYGRGARRDSHAWDLQEFRRAPGKMGSRLGRTVVALGDFADSAKPPLVLIPDPLQVPLQPTPLPKPANANPAPSSHVDFAQASMPEEIKARLLAERRRSSTLRFNITARRLSRRSTIGTPKPPASARSITAFI